MSIFSSRAKSVFRSNRGFSLLEMIVAIAVMGLALSVLYQSISGATRNMRISAEFAYATALAESAIDEFTAEVSIGKATQGQSDIYTWSAVAAPLEGALSLSSDVAPQPGLALITVVVTWAGLAGDRELVLQTITPVEEISNAT